MRNKIKNMAELGRSEIKDTYFNSKKEEILRTLNETNIGTYHTLEKKMGMSKPLVCYHINGNLHGPGLIEKGLVKKNLTIKQTLINIEITELGQKLLEDFDKIREKMRK